MGKQTRWSKAQNIRRKQLKIKYGILATNIKKIISDAKIHYNMNKDKKKIEMVNQYLLQFGVDIYKDCLNRPNQWIAKNIGSTRLLKHSRNIKKDLTLIEIHDLDTIISVCFFGSYYQ